MVEKTIKTKTNRQSLVDAVKELLRLPYSRILLPDPEAGLYAAEILEFPGCFAQGQSPDEAYANLEAAAESWLLSFLEQGKDVPRPLTNLEASGKFALRLPRSLYERASKAAARDCVSLNQLIVTAVAEHLGATTAIHAMRSVVRELKVVMVAPEQFAATSSVKLDPRVTFRDETTSRAVGLLTH